MAIAVRSMILADATHSDSLPKRLPKRQSPTRHLCHSSTLLYPKVHPITIAPSRIDTISDLIKVKDMTTPSDTVRPNATDDTTKGNPALYDAETLSDMRTRDLVPSMPTHLSAPGVNLGAYINTVHQIPILTPTQEQELAHRYYDDGDVEAARLLVMSHLRFVIHIARSYSGYGLPQADLIQEGNLGLMKAVKRFDPNKGVRLVSFAVHWIKAEIHEFVIRNWRWNFSFMSRTLRGKR